MYKQRNMNNEGAPCAVKVARTVLSGGKVGNIGNGRLTYRNTGLHRTDFWAKEPG